MNYVCPMHADVRLAADGKCPHCGMALIPEGTPFGFLRHMLSNPLHIAFMVGGMLALMAGLMMLMR
jgi:heavy metal-binding protein